MTTKVKEFDYYDSDCIDNMNKFMEDIEVEKSKHTRVKKGGKYLFINSFGKVADSIDSRTALDDERFESLNYFFIDKYKEAEIKAKQIRDILRGEE